MKTDKEKEKETLVKHSVQPYGTAAEQLITETFNERTSGSSAQRRPRETGTNKN